MRIYSWNVNGIRAIERKGLLPWDQDCDADVWVLQETKARADQLSEAVAQPAGWTSHWFAAEKAGYSGVALFAKRAPDEIIEGFEDPEYDCEGRVITGVFGNIAVVGAYFPNSQEAGKRIDYKLGFCEAMEDHLQGLRDRGLGTVLLGDYNIAHRPIDLARPKANEGSPGYLPEERAWMDHYIDELGYHDVFREDNPDQADAYTWWSYRGGARTRNVGWRIDYTTVSEEIRGDVTACGIAAEIMGSDHCPVWIDIRQ